MRFSRGQMSALPGGRVELNIFIAPFSLVLNCKDAVHGREPRTVTPPRVPRLIGRTRLQVDFVLATRKLTEKICKYETEVHVRFSAGWHSNVPPAAQPQRAQAVRVRY